MMDFEREAKEILLQILSDVNNNQDSLFEFWKRMKANADDITALLNKHRAEQVPK